MNRLGRICLWAMLLAACCATVSAAERKEFQAVVDPDGVQRVEVLGGSYFFNPDTIVVKVNVPVEMKIRKDSGITPHNFVLHAPRPAWISVWI